MIALAVVAALITLLLGYAAYRNVSANPSRSKKSRPAKAPISRRSWKQAMTDATKGFNISWIVVGLGIGGFLLCHWLLMEGFPTFYTKWRYSDAFIPMNVALLAIAVLMGQKHTALRVVRTALIVLVVIIGVKDMFTSVSWPTSSTPTGSTRTTVATASRTTLPANVALPIIAQCESGGRQFEDDGVTPLRNREGSSAFGKYQFLESHRETAKELGYDLNTEAGQDGYARHLYGLSGTQHWEADPRSKGCWEPKLVALGMQPNSETFGIEVGTEWTEYISIVKPWGLRSEPIGVRYQVQVDNHRPVNFPVENGQYLTQPRGIKVRFRSLENEPVKLVMRWK